METQGMAIHHAYSSKGFPLNILNYCFYKPLPRSSFEIGNPPQGYLCLEWAQNLSSSDFDSQVITVGPHSLFLSKFMPVLQMAETG